MDNEPLNEHLARLHEELANTQRVDAGATPLLAELMHEIQRLMRRPGAAEPSSPAESQAAGISAKVAEVPGAAEPAGSAPGSDASMPDRLERLAVQFEANHPTLAASSRRLIDLLGKVGV